MINLPFLQTYFSFINYWDCTLIWTIKYLLVLSERVHLKTCLYEYVIFCSKCLSHRASNMLILWHLESSTNNTAWQPIESHFLLSNLFFSCSSKNLPQDAGLCMLVFLKFREDDLSVVWLYIFCPTVGGFYHIKMCMHFQSFFSFPLITSHPFFESQEMIWL